MVSDSFTVHFENNKLDKCPVACKSIEYSATLSYALYPSNVQADQLAKKLNMTGSVRENRQFLRYVFITNIQ